ncbi:hypothetical protein SUGI_0755840 [Cryptomeria japonica]|uniref:agamous-like MADS-box protein AGL62 n=1 Tax=Cryptomeria japonica TaxID=3369 RepID=UPI0024148F46|nr:agamous-like MADS-box protein AGL62 [Cryptomeria japonica]GLJ37261.1 hypothetical protein SUGI_0755840 [Cryptomeria japonica]
MGKRKLEMTYIRDKIKRQKTFHNRKSGIFKKASELSVLCGCEVFMTIESEDGEIFKFGEDSNLAQNGALDSASFALPHIDNGGQEHPTEESLCAQSYLENAIPEITCWNNPFLEMGIDKDETHYPSNGLHSYFSNQKEEIISTDTDCNSELNSMADLFFTEWFFDSDMPL